MHFEYSRRSTLGVEWELQLVDTQTLDLTQCGPDIVREYHQACPQSDLIHAEYLQNTVELVSKPRQTVAQCLSDLDKGLEFALAEAEKYGAKLAGSGSHPFAIPQQQPVTHKGRYQELLKRTQWWGRQMLIFGTHVHVGVEDQQKVVPIMNFLTSMLGNLQGLFAASPFWAGIDTGYADNRVMMFQQLPTAGQPRRFANWEELETDTVGMIKTGVIGQFDEIRWDVRPAPKFGTIEVRAADASSNTAEVVACAALIQCLVEFASRLLDQGKDLPILPEWCVTENRWRAARYGLDTSLIVSADGNQGDARELLLGWVRRLEPIAADLGCLAELEFIHQILQVGAGYQRQRVAFAQNGSLKDVVALLVAEMEAATPLDAKASVKLTR